MSSNTANKNLNVPAHGADTNSWDVPVNANWQAIDTAFGGTTAISVTGVTTPNVLLTVEQYTPPNIEFTGVLSNDINYYFPTSVGGIWSVFNNTTGAFNLILASDTALTGSVTIPAGVRYMLVSDGTTVQNAVSGVPQSAVAAWQFSLDINGVQINQGTVGASVLPLVGTIRGNIVQADPGGTPSGVYGDIFWLY